MGVIAKSIAPVSSLSSRFAALKIDSPFPDAHPETHRYPFLYAYKISIYHCFEIITANFSSLSSTLL